MRRAGNGCGTVVKLSGNRARPWAAKVTTYNKEGRGYQICVGYAATEVEARSILAEYNGNPWNVKRETVTVADVYARWLEVKGPMISASSLRSFKSMYNCYLQPYYGIKYRNIRAHHIQKCINDCDKSYATKNTLRSFWGHLDRFAYENDIVSKTYAQLVPSAPAPETTREPFTAKQIKAIWNAPASDVRDMALVFLYTGARRIEILNLPIADIDLDKQLIKTGVKTASGKNRYIPIHPKIADIIRNHCAANSAYLFEINDKPYDLTTFYRAWRPFVASVGADGKVPHEARHSFESELDRKKANRKCRDMLLGHKSNTVGDRVYNHKTIDELRETILLVTYDVES